MNQTFGKEYKLCSHLLLEKLFQEGKKVRVFPFSINYLWLDKSVGKKKFQVVISIPKRKCKHSNERNYIKRCIIECLRKNKFIIEDPLNSNINTLLIAIIYNFDQHSNAIEIEEKLVSALVKLASQINKIN
jgi:ribonuclease P protein component